MDRFTQLQSIIGYYIDRQKYKHPKCVILVGKNGRFIAQALNTVRPVFYMKPNKLNYKGYKEDDICIIQMNKQAKKQVDLKQIKIGRGQIINGDLITVKYLVLSDYVPQIPNKYEFAVFEVGDDNFFNSTNYFSYGYTQDDWNKFNSFLIRCAQVYLQHGLLV